MKQVAIIPFHLPGKAFQYMVLKVCADDPTVCKVFCHAGHTMDLSIEGEDGLALQQWYMAEIAFVEAVVIRALEYLPEVFAEFEKHSHSFIVPEERKKACNVFGPYADQVMVL